MLPEWNLHYDDWIIGDGQPDRKVGERFGWFAVAFWTKAALMKVNEKSRSAVAIRGYKYRVVAEIVYLSETACVIDFGLKAIASSDLLSPGCVQGDHVTGEVCLSLPLCTEIVPEATLKSLAHRWKVNRISADLTPYVAHPDNPRFFIPDDSQIRYEEVSATSAIKAHTYVLHCHEDSFLYDGIPSPMS
jgi:hypothetical protein